MNSIICSHYYAAQFHTYRRTLLLASPASKGSCIVKFPFFSMKEVPEFFIVMLVPHFIIINKNLSRGSLSVDGCVSTTQNFPHVVTYIFTSHPVAFYQRGSRRRQQRWMILRWMKN